jgi:hypothetical protein
VNLLVDTRVSQYYSASSFGNEYLKMGTVCSYETLVSSCPHGVTNQKTNIDIFTAVRSSRLIQIYRHNVSIHSKVQIVRECLVLVSWNWKLFYKLHCTTGNKQNTFNSLTPPFISSFQSRCGIDVIIRPHGADKAHRKHN